MQGGAGQAWCANHCPPGLDAISSAPPFLAGSWRFGCDVRALGQNGFLRRRWTTLKAGKIHVVWVKYLTRRTNGLDASPLCARLLHGPLLCCFQRHQSTQLRKCLHLRAFCVLVVRVLAWPSCHCGGVEESPWAVVCRRTRSPGLQLALYCCTVFCLDGSSAIAGCQRHQKAVACAHYVLTVRLVPLRKRSVFGLKYRVRRYSLVLWRLPDPPTPQRCRPQPTNMGSR
jgi:hypothetical protein